MSTSKEWWLPTNDGRKIGYMWPEDFEVALTALYGKGWIQSFAAVSNLTETSIGRYKDGKQPIPKHIAALVTALSQMRDAKVEFAPEDPDWLPDAGGSVLGRATGVTRKAPAVPVLRTRPPRRVSKASDRLPEAVPAG